MVSEARAPTMLPARILWPHVNAGPKRDWIIAALSLMTRDELASLGCDRTYEQHAWVYGGQNEKYLQWESLPIALRARLLQYLHGEDSKLALRK